MLDSEIWLKFNYVTSGKNNTITLCIYTFYVNHVVYVIMIMINFIDIIVHISPNSQPPVYASEYYN